MWFESTNSKEIFVGNLDCIDGATKISLELVWKSAWPTYLKHILNILTLAMKDFKAKRGFGLEINNIKFYS